MRTSLRFATIVASLVSVLLGARLGLAQATYPSPPPAAAPSTAVIDIGGRPYTVVDLPFMTERLGSLGTQMIPHALEAFARTSGSTLNISATGKNDHHIAEAAFKAVALALRMAVARDGSDQVPSTKGTL